MKTLHQLLDFNSMLKEHTGHQNPITSISVPEPVFYYIFNWLYENDHSAKSRENLTGDKLNVYGVTIKKDTTNAYTALGWMYAELCSLTDKGIDIRKVTVPELLERYKKDFSDEA